MVTDICQPQGNHLVRKKVEIRQAKNPKVVGSYLGAGKGVFPIKIYFYWLLEQSVDFLINFNVCVELIIEFNYKILKKWLKQSISQTS